ncbi:MAG: FtsX-like permease family protein [Luteitalea sp.]|nr:FtsX-like permease family protein [Luteitalea sp.]
MEQGEVNTMWARFRSFARGLVRRTRVEGALAEELDFHLQARAEHWRHQGLPPAEAVRRARLEFGAVEGYKERCREARGLRFVDELRSDVWYAIRQLRRAPTFTLVATGTLAIGIGANAAIFSLINAVLLKTLPVERPHELRLLEWTARRAGFSTWYTWAPSIDGINTRAGSAAAQRNAAGEDFGTSFAYPVYTHVRDHAASFAELFAFGQPKRVNVIVGDRAELAAGLLVSGNFFRGLGVPALIGRAIEATDDQAGSPAVAVLGYRFWQRVFRSDERVVGQTIGVNGTPVVIVGIAPPTFDGVSPGRRTDVMVPITTMLPAIHDIPDMLQSARHWAFNVMGRVKGEVTEEQARAEAESLVQRAILDNPPAGEEYDLPRVALNPGGRGLDMLRREVSSALRILMAIVGTVLLIACANIAGLLLMRGAARRREIGTRLSLGAPRGRVVRQLLTESLLLAGLGGSVGIVLAFALRGLLPHLLNWQGRETIAIDMAPDVGMLAFALATCLVTGLVCGLAPALRATRVDLVPALARAVPGAADRSSRLWAGKTLVITQVALSFLLLVGAGLFVRTLVSLQSEALGFRPEQLLLFKLNAGLSGYEDSRLSDFFERVTKRAAAIPGVRAVSLSRYGLIGDGRNRGDIAVPAGKGQALVHKHYVGPRYFETMGIPLLRGRDIAWTDREGTPVVAIVNQALAKQLPNGVAPIGERIGYDSEATDLAEIIGVAADARFDSLREAAPPTLYLPYRQHPQSSMTFAVRLAGSPDAVRGSIRRAVEEIDPNVPMFGIRTQEAQISVAMGPERLLAQLVSGFALLALLLACLGIYGTLAYSVARRTSEIGLRMALGADRWDVVRMVLRESVVPVVLGVALGLGAAAVATRVIESMLFGVTPHDAPTLLAAALILTGSALLAAWLPSRRAARVDPMSALRCE